MILLRVLGTLEVRSSRGQDPAVALTQPKRLALLLYLALAEPPGPRSRESLMALLWPEADGSSGRHSLRNALHGLRQAFGDDAIVSRGEGYVGLEMAHVQCDALDLRRCVAEQRWEDAVALWGGELAPGFHLSGAPEFERWLEGLRAELQRMALDAAWRRVDQLAQAGDGGVVPAARRAWMLERGHEAGARRLMQLLDASGERAAALQVYDELVTHLREDFEADPSPETLGLAEALKARTERHVRHPVSAGTGATTGPSDAPSTLPRAVSASNPVVRAPRRWRAVGAAALAVVGGALLWSVAGAGRHPKPFAPRTVLVLPMENRSASPANDYLATGLADELAHQLRHASALHVVSAARSRWASSITADPVALGRRFGADNLVASTLEQMGDSLTVRAELIDAADGSRRAVAQRTIDVSQLEDRGSQLAAAVIGVLFRAPIPQAPKPSTRLGEPESYRLTIEGWHRLLSQGATEAARQSFARATEIDPANSRAWAGLSSAWASLTFSGQIPAEEGLTRTEAAARRTLALDSTDGTALANLGVVRAQRDGDVAGGLALVDRAKALDPGNPEIYLIGSVILRQSRRYDEARTAVRIARQLDPFNLNYADREGLMYLCEGRAAEALAIYRAAAALDSTSPVAWRGSVRSLARLGRWDEAIQTWRRHATGPSDTALAAVLAHARGQDGYWTAVHTANRPALERLLREARTEWREPVSITMALIGAGVTDSGIAKLAREARPNNPRLYNLACTPLVDELRGTPRFEAIVKRFGVLTQRTQP